MSVLLSLQLLELGQVVGDLEPGRLGADEDVSSGPDARLVDERPMATCTYAPSRTTEKRSEPQRAQRMSFSFSSPTTKSAPAPSVSSSCPRSIPAYGLKAEPVAARQREQWQFAAYRKASATR
jgi:hypothetical protein